MDEDVTSSVIGRDKTITLVRVEPFHCTLSHFRFSPTGRSPESAYAEPRCCDRPYLKPDSGIRGARCQNFAGAVTRTRISTATRMMHITMAPCPISPEPALRGARRVRRLR